MQREKLYKIDSKGKTRVWWIEYDNERYRTHSGIMDGAIVSSGWQYPTEKNAGRSNSTSVSEQVVREVDAEYVKKQHQGKYHSTLEATSNGAKFIECMLASKYDVKKHTEFPYFSQPKLDGVRCLISKDGMQSRNGKPIVSAPHIREALDDFFTVFPDVVLDGELYNHDLKNDFEKIISLARKTKPTAEDLEESKQMIQYHIYDCLTEGSYEDRLAFLADSLAEHYEPMIHVVETFFVHNQNNIDSFLGQWLEQGYEGQMLRVPESLYEGKRSKNLIKHKEFEDEEFEIVNIEEGLGNWAGYAKSVEIRLKDGTTQNSGVRGSQEFLKQILDQRATLVGTEVTVRYQNKTVDGKLRFPVVVAFWKGKREL